MTRAIVPALAGAADGKRYLRLGDFELYRSPTIPRWEIRMRDDDAARARQYPLGWHIEFGLLPVHALHRADLDVLIALLGSIAQEADIVRELMSSHAAEAERLAAAGGAS